VRIFLWILVAAVIGIQLIPVDRGRSGPPAGAVAPPAAQAVLERSCMNCHSYGTKWPWYSRVAPVSWMVASDVRRGREKMNLSDWSDVEPKQRAHLIHEVAEETSEGHMPPKIYLAFHRDARLTEEDSKALAAWGRLEEH